MAESTPIKASTRSTLSLTISNRGNHHRLRGERATRDRGIDLGRVVRLIGTALKPGAIQTELVVCIEHPDRAGHPMSFEPRNSQSLQQAHPMNGTGCA